MKLLPKEYAGTVLSDTTMRSEDLIPSFIRFLEQVAKKCGIEEEVEAIRKEANKLELEEIPDYGVYHKDEEAAGWLLNEDIWELLDDIAPASTYFGSHPGDGACYGFWDMEVI